MSYGTAKKPTIATYNAIAISPKSKKAVSVYSFGDGLSDEDLEQIIKLIEVKSC